MDITRTVDDYIQVDGKWKLKPESEFDNQMPGNNHNNQINQPLVRFDDYSNEDRGLKVLTAEEVLRQKGKGVKYYWGSFIPQKAVCLLSGETGVGKTTFSYNLAIKAAKGETFCDISFDWISF